MSYNIVITADNSGARSAINDTEKALNNMAATAKEGGGELDEMFSRIKTAAAGVFAGFTVTSFIKKVVEARGEMQQLEVAFQTMLGSKAKADKLMAEMTQTALITPFEFDDVANGARQLIAYGEGADTVNNTLVRLGNVASGLSQPLNDIVYLYGTTRVQGRLFTQDLNQFTNRGIPMIQKLAEQFGVTEDKVKDLVSEGKVGFPQVQKVIEDLTNEGGMFYNLMEEQSKTITGQISNLEDQLSTIYNEIGQASEGVITSALSGAADLLEHWEAIGKAILYMASAYGVVKAALAAYVAVQKASAAVQAAGGIMNYVKGIFGLTSALSGATKAQYAMNAAAYANPYALLAAAVVGLCYGLYKLCTATDAAEESQENFNKRVGELQADAEQSFDRLRELETAYNQGKIKIEEYTTELNKLKDVYPDIIQAHTDEKTGLLDIVEAQKAVNKAIEQRVAMEEMANLKTEQTKAVLQAQGEEMSTWTKEITEFFTDIFKEKGDDEVTAKDKAKRIASSYKEAWTDEMRDFDFSTYDMTKSEGQGKAKSELSQKLKGRLDALTKGYQQEAQLTQKQSQELSHMTVRDAYDAFQGASSYFNNTFDAYLERAEQVQKAQEAYGDLLADTTRGGNGGGGGGNTEKVDALSAAWKTYNDTLAGRDELLGKVGRTEEDEADIRRKNTELNQLKEEITLLEASLQGHKAITEEIAKWSKARESAVDKDESKSIAKQIDALKKRDPNSEEKKQTKTTKADSTETAKAELSEAQKLAFQKEKAAQIAEQAEIDAMEDGTKKKLRQINLDYNKRKLAIAQNEAKLQAQAEADKKNGTGTGEIAEDDLLGLENDKTEAYNEFLKKTRAVSQEVLNETQSYWDKRAAIIKKGQANIANIQALESEGLIDTKSAERRTAEVQKSTDDSVANLDIAQAQQDPAFKAWQDTLGTMALKAMKDALAKSEEVLKSLEKDDSVDDDELVKVRAQVATLKNEVATKEAAPDALKNVEAKAKAYMKLAKKIRAVTGDLGDLEEAITGTRSKTMQACTAIMDFGIQVAETMLEVALQTMQAEQQTAAETAASIKTIENASVILAVIGAVIQAVTKMVQIFSDDSAEQARLQALSEYYSALADTIGTVIERQEEMMENATGDQVSAVKDSTEALYKKQEQAYRLQAKTRTEQTDDGNKHSVGYHENKKVRANQDRLKEITGQSLQYASQLADLDAATLKRIQEEMPDFWASLDETYRSSLEKIIETGDAIDELDDKAKEQRLGFSFDDLESNFKDCLIDLDSDADTFNENLEDNLRTSIINGLVYNSEMKARLQKLYDKINDTLADDSLSDEEKMRQVDEIKGEINAEQEAAREKAKQLYGLAGLDGTTSATEAETAGFSGMSQETAEELNGRFTAIQGHTYLINQSVTAIATNNKTIAERMASIISMSNTMLSLASARNQIIQQIYSLMSNINAKGLRLLS